MFENPGACLLAICPCRTSITLFSLFGNNHRFIDKNKKKMYNTSIFIQYNHTYADVSGSCLLVALL